MNIETMKLMIFSNNVSFFERCVVLNDSNKNFAWADAKDPKNTFTNLFAPFIIKHNFYKAGLNAVILNDGKLKIII